MISALNAFTTKVSTVLVAILLLWLAACSDRHSSASESASAADTNKTVEEHTRTDQVKLTAEQLSQADLGFAKVGPATISETLPVYGVIAPNAERVLEVGARFPGVIRTVTKRIGDAVRKGETLATVESNESLQTYAIPSPLDGVVTQRKANPGEQTGDRALFTVADLSTVWVELSVFARDIGKIRVGQEVRVKNTDTSASALGKVVYVAPFGSTQNQTLTARVLLDNRKREWPPGLYVSANVVLASNSVPLAVANDALQTWEDRSVVFVRNGEGFEPRPVQLGRSDGQFTEVRAGLTAGEPYVTQNSFVLKAELGKGEAEEE